MNYHESRSRRFAMLAWIAFFVGPGPAQLGAQSHFSGDIVCLSNREQYLLPGKCQQNCPSQANLANLNALNYGGVNGKTFCDLKALTPEIAQDVTFRQFYDLAVWNKILGGHPVPRDPPKLVLVAHIVNTYYPPYRASSFAIGFGPSKEHWAGLTSTGPGAKPDLIINEDLFWLTPAFVLSTLGHEMVHMDQLQRHYNTRATGIDAAQKALWELEAYSWQLGKDKFPRSFKIDTPLVPYMQDSEKAELDVNFECDQWDVNKAIMNIMTGPRSVVYGKALASWLQEDAWVDQIWLPQNPDWETRQPGPRPQVCK
jgi:hypothetical protein